MLTNEERNKRRYRVRWKRKDADEWHYGPGTMNYANAKAWDDEMIRKGSQYIHGIVLAEVTDEQSETHN